jgi:hypothetical protein
MTQPANDTNLNDSPRSGWVMRGRALCHALFASEQPGERRCRYALGRPSEERASGGIHADDLAILAKLWC